MQHSYDGLDRPGGFSRLNLLRAAAPPRLPAALDGDDGVALRRRHLPRRDGVAGVRGLERAGRALDGRDRDDGADDRRASSPAASSATASAGATIMLAADAVRAAAIAVLAVLSADGPLQVWEIAALAMVYGAGTAFFNAGLRGASCPTSCPRPTCRPPTRSTSSCARSRCAWRARRRPGWLIASLGPGLAFAADAASFACRPGAPCSRCGTPRPRHGPSPSVVDDIASGLDFIRRRVVALGHARLGRVRLPALPRPDRGAPALRRQEQPARLGRHARGGVRRGRDRLDRRGGADGPARPAPPPGDVHLRGLDARDAGGRRLRPGHRDLAARCRVPALQRARDRRHDRVGDAQAAPRARRRCSAGSRASTG